MKKSILNKLTSLVNFFGHKIHTDIFISDIFKLTINRLEARKYRTFLTIFGVGVGIGVVYILVSLTFGLQRLVIGNIATNETILTLDVLPNSEVKDFLKINQKMIEDFKGSLGVSEVRAAKSLPIEVSYNDIKSQSLAYGVEPRYFALSNVHTDQGELYQKNEPKIVVSTAVLSLFGLDPKKAVGTKVRISFLMPNAFFGDDTGEQTATTGATLLSDSVVEIPEQLTISGVIIDDSNYLYLPLSYFDLVNRDEYSLAKVKVKNQSEIEPVREILLNKGFTVSAMTDTLAQINKIFGITQIIFTVIGITALFIAAIGMVNTMTISLLERTREIGIMKSIGATTQGIKQMFLMESILIGLGGGLGGLLIGFVATKILSVFVTVLALSFGGKPANIFYTPPWFLLLVLAFSLVIGLVTGIFPARRAAKINPLDALRYE